MSAFGRRPWGQQKPPLGFGLREDSHWSKEGLVGEWLFNESNGTPIELITNTRPSENTSLWTPNGKSFSGQQINYGNIFDTPNELTAICWIKPTGTYATYNKLILKRNANRGIRFDFMLHQSTGNISFYNGSAVTTSAVQPPTTQWSQVAVTVSKSGILQFYHNGKSVYSATGKSLGPNSTAQVTIGAYLGVPSWKEFYYGEMANASVYSRALCPDEIASLYAEPYQMIEGWNYGRVYSIPSAAFINSTFWFHNAIQEAI